MALFEQRRAEIFVLQKFLLSDARQRLDEPSPTRRVPLRVVRWQHHGHNCTHNSTTS